MFLNFFFLILQTFLCYLIIPFLLQSSLSNPVSSLLDINLILGPGPKICFGAWLENRFWGLAQKWVLGPGPKMSFGASYNCYSGPKSHFLAWPRNLFWGLAQNEFWGLAQKWVFGPITVILARKAIFGPGPKICFGAWPENEFWGQFTSKTWPEKLFWGQARKCILGLAYFW